MTENDYLYVTGRLVQGDVFQPQTKNMQGGPLTNLKGEPKVQYFIGVAVPKNDQIMLASYAQMQAIAQAGFPGGESQRADFAWKVVDGDDPKNAQKVGFPGCFVFRFTSGYPVEAWKMNEQTNQYERILDPSMVKRGYHIRVAFTVKANGNLQKPGLYLNTGLVEFIGYGDVISSGPDAAALLGAAGPAQMPAGASATPLAAGPPINPGMTPGAVPGHVPGAIPGAAVPGAVPGQMPGAVPGTPGAPGVPGITPAPDFLNPAAPGAPAPAAAPPVMTAKAAGATYQQFIDKGWQHADLVAQGYVVA